jgi:hypothetical protein
MAMPTRDSTITTIEELLALPRTACATAARRGHAVTRRPALASGRLERLDARVVTALAGRDDLQVLTSPADIVLDPSTLVQPDLFVIRRRLGQTINEWSDVGVPVVAIGFSRPVRPLATAAPNAGSTSAPVCRSTGLWISMRGSWNGGGRRMSGPRSSRTLCAGNPMRLFRR